MTKEYIETLRRWANNLGDDGDSHTAHECLDEIERLQRQVRGYDSIVATIADVVHERTPLLRRFEEYEERKP